MRIERDILLVGSPTTGAEKSQETRPAPSGALDTFGRTGLIRVRLTVAETAEVYAKRALDRARAKLYAIAGGSYDSNDVMASRLTVQQRVAYFRTPEFKNWVRAERACGREVFWLKDLDKTQAAGDIFTFFFKWRADNAQFSEAQNDELKKFFAHIKAKDPTAISDEEMAKVATNSGSENGHLVVELWQRKEAGHPGLSLIDFWEGAYWPTQLGLTEQEKADQVRAFAPHYAKKIFPHAREDNEALAAAGVHVVIVSNGDQELAQAVAPLLGIDPRNVVGSNLIYENGVATKINHSYEIFDPVWNARPQGGKPLSYHFWMNKEKERFGWSGLDENRIVVAGRDGDSASSDGGMMILMMKQAAIGNFMVDTPNEPGRLQKMLALARKYGWTKGQFVTLAPDAPASGAIPD